MYENKIPNEGLENETIREFYNLAVYDYEKGTDIEELKIILFDYEDKEMYLECAGISMAIEYIEFLITIELIKYINNIDDNERN